MNSFDSYFTADQIIRLLCKYRIKYAKQRHKVHLMRDISLHPFTLNDFKNKHHCPDELSKLLPPRRSWNRLNEKERKNFKSSANITIESLRRTILTTHLRVKDKSIQTPIWYLHLADFIKSIQERVNSENPASFEKPSIIAIKKENRRECRKFRPISQFALADRIIIGQTARYLTAIFDDQLLDCAYAFRAIKKGVGIKTHHDTINRIISYKGHHVGKDIYVAECDIKKFFDCVNQDHIKKIFLSFVNRVKENNIPYDEKASIFFYQYLNSYAFNLDVYPLKDTDYFVQIGCEGGEFEWPESLLKREFYGDDINQIRIGVPQGGALSCLISNLLLHNVDEDVLLGNVDKEIEYFRFCDDMLLLSISEEACNKALSRYTHAIKRNFLLIHEPKEISSYGKEFFNSDISKSKKPFKWGHPKISNNSSPWISFVGYQVRYDGVIRVRKKSLLKEIKKQEKESTEVLKALHSSDISNINHHSRKSIKQQLIALESRLIAMSVGRQKLFNYKKFIPVLCWTNGFKRLSLNATTKSQLKLLDSKRNRQIFRLKKALASLDKKSERPDHDEIHAKYLGAPFSYYGFLNKKNNSKM